MRYFIRSVKYLVWFVAVFAIIISIFVLTSADMTFDRVFSPEGGLFKPNALPQLIAFFVLFSAIYPALSFMKKEVFIGGSFEECRDKIISAFTEYGYELVNEDDNEMTFRIKKPFIRFMRMYEDAITITKDESPLILKGMRKEIFRLASAIEFTTRNQESE